MTKPTKTTETIYELEITLREITPRIWRRFAVPGHITLATLHEIIQVVMGWENCHLHEFRIGKDHYGIPDPEMEGDFGLKTLNEKKFKLSDVLGGKGTKFKYEYDFGDGWIHELKVVKIGPPDPNIRYPVCLAGERACPPEDCGSIPGYERLLEIIADPQNEEYEEMMDWLGGDFDPEEFHIGIINEILKKIRC